MEAIIALTALTAMEIVLGIDNIVFIAILVGRLPENRRALARRLGLGAAMVTRILLLLTLSWILELQEPIFELTDLGIPDGWVAASAEDGWFTEHVNGVSWRDVILLAGGLFLVGKSVHEIHDKLEGHAEGGKAKKAAGFAAVLIQIAILDIVFSLDSVITAIGMAEEVWVMITAVVLAVGVMLIFAGAVSAFVDRHPTLKMLALSFLILIGVMLVAEGVGSEINKGYIYFAMAFALGVECLNLRMKSKLAVKKAA